jgi:hypothetical protein
VGRDNFFALFLLLVGSCLWACSTSGPSPSAQGSRTGVREIVYDFGEIAQGEKLSHSFSIKNKGSEELVFEEIWSTGIMPAIILNRWIDLGKEDKITLVLDTSKLLGDIETGAILHTNDPQQHIIEVKMKGKVKPPFELQPYSALFISAFRGEEKEGAVTIVNNAKQPLKITRMISKSEQFRPRLETVKAGHRYRLLVKVSPQAFPGRSKDTVFLYTDSEKKPVIEIPVKLLIKNEVYAIPDYIDFGTFKLDALEQAAHGEKMMIGKVLLERRHRPGQKDFQISIASDLPFLKVENSPLDGGRTYQLSVYLVKAKLVRGSFNGKIRVHTNDKMVPLVIIPVIGNIS